MLLKYKHSDHSK